MARRSTPAAARRCSAPRPLGPFQDVAAATGGHLAAVVRSDARPADVLAALLAELRRRRPTIVVIEDVHWADDATLDVVRLPAGASGASAALVRRDASATTSSTPCRPLRGAARRPRYVPAVRRLAVAAALPGQRWRALAAPHGVDAGGAAPRGPAATRSSSPRCWGPAGGGSAGDRAGRRAGARRRGCAGRAACVEAVAVVPGGVPARAARRARCPTSARRSRRRRGRDGGGEGAGVRFRHELARLALDSTSARRAAAGCNARVLRVRGRAGEPPLARLAHHAEGAGDGAAVLRVAPPAAERAAAPRRTARRPRSTPAPCATRTAWTRRAGPSCWRRTATSAT